MTSASGDDRKTDTQSATEILRLSADIVAAYVAQNAIPAAAVPELIGKVHGTLANLGAVEPVLRERQRPRSRWPSRCSMTSSPASRTARS